MTIKKQTNILITLIAAIPVFCLTFIFLHHYFTSTARYLIDGSKQISSFCDKKLSEKDQEELFSTLKLIPPHIETCVLSEDNTIIFSTIPELKSGIIFSQKGLWTFVGDTSDDFFYQFTAVKLNTTNVSLITRIHRENNYKYKSRGIIVPVLILITILVLICVVVITIVTHTIFKSLIKIEETTQQLAEGNLSQEIITSSSDIKENEITSTLKALEKMRLSLLEEQNRKNKFIMGISHDLRTPVAIIKGYIEAISDGIITDKKELTNALNLVKTKSDQLDNMIDSLINFIKIDNIEIKENLLPASITKIINNFAQDSQITANVFKRTIKTNIALSEDIIVPLNEQLFLRALENLFSNALRYTKNNDIIEINSYTSENKLFIEIKDTGIGIAEEDLKYIFDMFYRGTNSRHEEGLGIGLSVVKNIIRTHGWSIDVKSKKDKGSCFTITIPYN